MDGKPDKDIRSAEKLSDTELEKASGGINIKYCWGLFKMITGHGDGHETAKDKGKGAVKSGSGGGPNKLTDR